MPELDLPALRAAIEEIWSRREEITPQSDDERRVVLAAIQALDRGEIRVAEIDPASDRAVVNEWVKQAILLLFKVMAMKTTELGPFEYADRIPLKHGYQDAGVRVLPGGSARFGSYLESGVVLMPGYVNIGARVGANTMVDTWATVGSCAQIGRNVHLSGGVGIGGVLEPPQAAPVIVEDEAFIGSRAMITEGARVGQGAVIGAGVVLNPSIPVYDSETGVEISRGHVPPWAVAIAASRRREFKGGEFFLPCVLVIKRLEPGQRHNKTQLNQILREHNVAT
jgi:2,3,4,5-tetrahydropyridine-2-carboxylate N-succinyltransferase